MQQMLQSSMTLQENVELLGSRAATASLGRHVRHQAALAIANQRRVAHMQRSDQSREAHVRVEFHRACCRLLVNDVAEPDGSILARFQRRFAERLLADSSL